MKLVPWMVFLSLIAVSCSGSKSSQPVKEETPQVELSDADEFIENPSGEPAAVTETQASPLEEPTTEASSPEVAAADTTDASSSDLVIEEEPVAAAEKPVVATGAPLASKSLSENMMEYKVQKNETLMMISFKLYGDYGWWKKLAGWNTDKLKGGQIVRAGQTLKYMAPSEEFVWNPQGLPHLIRTGDTLSLISKTVYQTPKKWKLIWENNRPLIKNPNLIFAGFTIYYLENGREVASGI